jgi:hypothetical protein
MKIKIVIAILCMLVIPTVVGVAPTDSNDTYSYIIFRDGNNIYAKNGVTGTIDKVSTDASETFTYAITHLPSGGGSIFVKAGGYIFSYGLPIIQGLHIVGEGVVSTVLTMSASATTPMFSYSGSTDIYFFTLEHLSLSCQTGTNSMNCIKTNTHVNDGLIYDCYIMHFKGDGIDLGTTWGWRIDQSVFEYMSGDGIHLHGGCNGYITNTKVILNEGNDINLDGSVAVTMMGNYIGQCGKNGVLFNGTQVCSLMGNKFYQSDKYKTGLYSDIYLTSNSKNNIICGNDIEGAQCSKYNIYLGGTSSTTKNIISINRMSGAVSGTIRRQSSNIDLVKNNMGYTTESYGIGTIMNSNSVTINHGLSTTPKAILITPIGKFISYYVDSVTSSKFTLYVNTSITLSFYWTAFA